MENIHTLIVSQHDFLESLAAIATTFAFLVPLPIYVISSWKRRKFEARERAFTVLEKLDEGSSRALRDRILAIINKRDMLIGNIEDILDIDEKSDLREFMNKYEIISVYLNTSRINDRVFLSFWKNAFIKDWERLCPYILSLRTKFGPQLYVEWERAVAIARKNPK